MTAGVVGEENGQSMTRALQIRITIIVAFALGLEAICRSGLVSRFILVPPSDMMLGIVRILSTGSLDAEIVATGAAIAAAAAMACVLGFVVGVALHAVPRARIILDPLLSSYYSVPIFVFYPLFIVFLGVNEMPKVAIGFLLAVVAMITNTLNGLDRVPRVLLKTARINRLGPVKTAVFVVLPSAAPSIFAGVKFAIAYSFVGVLGAEFILSSSGIGYQIAFAFNAFDNETMYALILFVFLVVSVVISFLFASERKMLQRRGLQ
jgi:NitT/TauT family transport system permease protein